MGKTIGLIILIFAIAGVVFTAYSLASELQTVCTNGLTYSTLAAKSLALYVCLNLSIASATVLVSK